MSKGTKSEPQFMNRRQLLTTGAVLAGATGVTAAGIAGAPEAAAAGAGWKYIQYRSVDTRDWGWKPYKGYQTNLGLMYDKWGTYRLPSSGVVAVSYNLTITETEGAGYVAMWKYALSDPGVSSINWRSAGLDIANGGIVGVAYNGYVTVKVEGTYYAKTHFIVDVTGYFS